MRPVDLAAEQTVNFVLAHLPSRPVRILDVGCGWGLVARRLQDRGHELVAIDEEAEIVAGARALGHDSRMATWPAFDDAPFDVVLFGRSLHHIQPLGAAIEQAHRLLRPTGLVLVDEFAWAEIDPATAEWFYSTTRQLDACRMLISDDDSFAADLLRRGGEFRFWQDEHDRDLHPVTEMWSALRSHFLSLSETSAPYLDRYLCQVLPENQAGCAIAARILAVEERLAQLGAIVLIGRRFVGSKG
jgi:SAM-dependent methyltransferase